MRQVFNKGLDSNETQEGLLKRLKNIEDKTDNLRAIKDKDNQLGVKAIDNIIKEELSEEAKNILKNLTNQEKIINYRKLYLKGGNNSEYDFTDYRSLLEFFKAIYYRKNDIEKVKQNTKSLKVHMEHWKGINQKKIVNMLNQEKNF